VDLAVNKVEREVKRTPDAVRWNGTSYTRIDLTGEITLINRREQPIEIEITRHVLGRVGEANQNGTSVMVNLLDGDQQVVGDGLPSWWGWYQWPSWWANLNGVGKLHWTLKLEPNKPATLTYSWSYFWN
jgi:hypothetical protein